MAAPTTAYYNNANTKFPFKQAGVLQLETLLALNLYGDVYQIKNEFHLDEVLVLTKHDGVGTETVFIGACRIDGENINFHTPSRYFHARLSIFYGVKLDYILFNDCGLNTKPSIVSLAFIEEAGSAVAFDVTFKSAFYNLTTEMVVEYSLSGQFSDYEIVFGLLPANQTLISGRTEFEFAPAFGQTIYMRARITNDEGTTYSNWMQTTRTQACVLFTFDTGLTLEDPYTGSWTLEYTECGSGYAMSQPGILIGDGIISVYGLEESFSMTWVPI